LTSCTIAVNLLGGRVISGRFSSMIRSLENMHKACLDRETLDGLQLLARNSWMEKWYLAGGTAVALHFGHRKSFDLDFFSESKFSVSVLRGELEGRGTCALSSEEEYTLTGVWRKIKVSFMRYPYRLLEKPFLWDGIR